MTSLAKRGATVSGIDADRNRPQVKWALRPIRVLPERLTHKVKVLPNLTIIEGDGRIACSTHRRRRGTHPIRGRRSRGGGVSRRLAISQADIVVIPCGPSYLDVEAAAVLRVVQDCEMMARKPIHIPAAVLLTKTSPAVKPDTQREVSASSPAHQTPLYDVQLHPPHCIRGDLRAGGVPLHDLPARRSINSTRPLKTRKPSWPKPSANRSERAVA